MWRRRAPRCRMLAQDPVLDPVGEDVGLDLVGALAPPVPALIPLAVAFCQPRAAVQGDPAHQLGGHVVLGLAAGLPDPLVGLAPGLRRGVDLIRDDRPDRGRDLAVGLRVDVEGVDERAIDVVLTLVEGAVPDPDRTGAAVAGEVVERRFGQVALAADAVHDLELVAVPEADVADVAGEVLRLGVEAEHVQAPEGEGRVADPAVAVVPVALAPRRLRERGGGGGEHRSAWRVAERLQGQRRALQVDPPRMVGEAAGREPAAPVLGGRVDAVESLLGRLGRLRLGTPGERAEPALPVDHAMSRLEPLVLDREVQVAGEEQVRESPSPPVIAE